MPSIEQWGLKDNPYTTTPINADTLAFFVGRIEERKQCLSALLNKSIIVIEGSRGVGTTSLGNFVRFTHQTKNKALTVTNEISVQPGWNIEILLANVLSSVIWSLEEKVPNIEKDKNFKEIKRITHHVREVFHNIGLQLTPIAGGQLGKQPSITVPSIYPTTTLIQNLSKAKALVKKYNFSRDIVVQLNNLDIGTMLSPEQIRFFLNDIRDVIQREGFSWILVGDSGLRNFITENVDRLDDIVTLEIAIEPLSLNEVHEVIDKRIKALTQKGKRPIVPVEKKLIDALYRASGGRIRQIFGIATRLLNLTTEDSLCETMDIKSAQTLLKRLVEARINQNKISPKALDILNHLIKNGERNPGQLAKEFKVSRSNVSRELLKLKSARLVEVKRISRHNIYYPATDVKIGL